MARLQGQISNFGEISKKYDDDTAISSEDRAIEDKKVENKIIDDYGRIRTTLWKARFYHKKQSITFFNSRSQRIQDSETKINA